MTNIEFIESDFTDKNWISNVLSSKYDKNQIKRIINTQLNGNGIAMQMCRSICFECRLHDVNQIIYAGMYDLENAVPVSSVMFYNKNLSHSMTDKSVQQCESLWRLANMIYSKKFS